MNKSFEPFNPPFTLRNPHVQTLLSYVIKRYPKPFSNLHLVELKDQDKLALEVHTPSTWKESNLTVLMMHGVGGSSNSPYLLRLTSKFSDFHIQTACLNFRGIGKGAGLSKKVSHGGSWEEVYETVLYLKKTFPLSPLIVIGFSLSGNTLLKLAAKVNLAPQVEKILAICPAIDLERSSKRLESWQNTLYRQSILKALIQTVESPESSFSYRPKRSLKGCKTLKEFDDLFTAPACGFKNALEYYQKASSYSLIPSIKTQTHILFSRDDPLIDCSSLKDMALPSNIEVLYTKYGGHMGFLNALHSKNLFWMDDQIFQWLSLKP